VEEGLERYKRGGYGVVRGWVKKKGFERDDGGRQEIEEKGKEVGVIQG
jgi:hypothetical protein